MPADSSKQAITGTGRSVDFLVNVDVDDLKKAVHFYGVTFGLQIGRRFAAMGAEMLGGSAPIYLRAKEAGTSSSGGRTQARNYERHWTPTHLDCVVEDIEGAVETAIDVGARLEKPMASWE